MLAAATVASFVSTTLVTAAETQLLDVEKDELTRATLKTKGCL